VGALRIFISHHHEEKLLALAWQELVRTLTMGAVVPWYSSDERAGGGVIPGEWRPQVQQEIENASVILVLITPVSNDKPWVFYESGLASGQHKTILPVYYFMRQESLNSIFKSSQCYQGDSKDGPTGITALCGRLLRVHLGHAPSDDIVSTWQPLIERYLDKVRDERENSHARTLFQDHFHDIKAATAMEGDWFSKWTQIHDDNTEEVFEVDSLFVWTTADRLRMVGMSEKQGRELLSTKAREAARFYPMEGVVSKAGWVAMSYWSGGVIPICGTTLLVPKGSTGELLVGTWQGYTAKHVNDDPSFTTGRVVMSRNKEVVAGYWPELRR
jgi:hypothetical protein